MVQITPRLPEVATHDADGFEQLIKLGFGSKRKMLRNNLKPVIEREALTALMLGLGIAETARAEDLSVGQWVALSNTILKQYP